MGSEGESYLEGYEPQESKKWLWLIIGIFLIILIIILTWYFVFSSNDDLENKRKQILEKARTFLPPEELLILEEAINNASTIEELNELEDSIDDFLNVLETTIDFETCVENWTCTDWSGCVDGNKTRTCVDLNNCGTTLDKPDEEKECEIQTIDCGTDIDCFIGASESCDLAQFTWILDSNLFGVDQTTTSYYELKGLQGSECVYYLQYGEINVSYGDELVQQLLNSGMTQEEIDQKEQEVNEQYDVFEGRGGTCKISPTNLTIFLTKVKEDTLSGGVSCTINFGGGSNCTYSGDWEFFNECEGDYFSTEI